MKNKSTKKITIAAFSGSLRKESYTTKLVKAFQKSAPKNIEVRIVDTGKLPLMNEDLESEMPDSVKALHKSIEEADGILLVTPEYNRSFTPSIKNALDWGSRPEGENKWDGKPVAVAGCTPYSIGAFGAQNHLRQVLMYLNMPNLQQPEFYLTQVAEKFNEKDELTDKKTQQKIDELWAAFVNWIEKINR